MEGDKGQEAWPCELRSFRPKVDLPEGVRQDLSRFAQRHTTLYNMLNLPLGDVILVNLGFHMCSHCLSMLTTFFSGLKNDKCSLGEST